MTRPMIENSDRGITVNKSLAWTMLVAIVAAGFWVGTVVTSAQHGIAVLEERQAEDRIAIRANSAAISVLRQTTARVEERLGNIERSAVRTEEAVTEILRFLRSDTRQP